MHATQRAARGGGPVRWSVSALLAVVLVAVLAACGDDGGSSGSTASPSPAVTATATATGSATTGSPGATAGATAPADPAAATAQVTANWEKFFSPQTPLADKAALLQNGDQLVPVLQGFAQDPRVGQVQAKVTGVQFSSASEAVVTYELSLQGNVVEPAATGQAVLENGTWKVSRSTLCGLLAQAGATATPLPGCS